MQGAQAVQTSAWRKLLSKKWVFPALYMAAAAIILTLVWVYQDMNQQPLDPNKDATQVEQPVDSGTLAEGKTNDEAVEVVASNETLGWPVADAQDVDVVMSFYDDQASKEEQAAAMVEYKQTFTPNVGIDLARKDQKGFDVLAAMSGKVIRAEQNPMTGFVVEIDHGNGLKTVYQSLADMKVKKGDTVKKGDALAAAGRNELEKDLGVHVHFEVYDDNKPVNPSTLLAKN
ncbi:M23 family metallopeptidase [Paenibacillus apiarius]|uniref:M23 family metallopeptidase n=2 Tax=Paenibacillus apiarius TaxID=46240 RepID=A0ABT4DSL2_9BACL|nr:M23 family metallopeptidase [Paenibacillus apiarius]MBN3523906.1 M23 family metallopeptidase [Paenibacillus apiarius]MCY9514219.1 M23 family metallopeptidase [Paenibacillus apiarius]MCY9520342.1 M23 family metallopeptidase [Paenibacillus apiarius]MCY9554761.1 M23 family metallopeptidase [Paenibacillus apiarius]MCY9557378.1 M23 family metallopeptidase [Paenibacillus apiarius]